MKKLSLFIIIFFFSLSPLFSQQKATTTKSSTQVVQQYNPQWEYIVISYGKTYFDTPEKTIAYYALTRGYGQEGLKLQQYLDGLGKMGWEVITVVGTIGGDQQIFLKRRYEAGNKEKDEKIIKQEVDKWQKEMEDQTKKEKEETQKNARLLAEKKILVDLDKVDEEKRNNEFELALASYINEIEALLKTDMTVEINNQDEFYRYVINVEYDLTKDFLRNKNEYRSSEVIEYLHNIIEKTSVDTEKLGYRSLVIKYMGFILMNGEKVTVYTGEKEYN